MTLRQIIALLVFPALSMLAACGDEPLSQPADTSTTIAGPRYSIEVQGNSYKGLPPGLRIELDVPTTWTGELNQCPFEVRWNNDSEDKVVLVRSGTYAYFLFPVIEKDGGKPGAWEGPPPHPGNPESADYYVILPPRQTVLTKHQLNTGVNLGDATEAKLRFEYAHPAGAASDHKDLFTGHIIGPTIRIQRLD